MHRKQMIPLRPEREAVELFETLMLGDTSLKFGMALSLTGNFVLDCVHYMHQIYDFPSDNVPDIKVARIYAHDVGKYFGCGILIDFPDHISVPPITIDFPLKDVDKVRAVHDSRAESHEDNRLMIGNRKYHWIQAVDFVVNELEFIFWGE